MFKRYVWTKYAKYNKKCSSHLLGFFGARETGPESIFIFVSLTKVARMCSLGGLGGRIDGGAYTKKRFQANYSSADQNAVSKKNTFDYNSPPLPSPHLHRPVAFIEMNSIYFEQLQKKKDFITTCKLGFWHIDKVFWALYERLRLALSLEYSMHCTIYAIREKEGKTSVVQADSKVTLHTITS